MRFAGAAAAATLDKRARINISFKIASLEKEFSELIGIYLDKLEGKTCLDGQHILDFGGRVHGHGGR